MRFSLHQIQSQALTAGVVILIATFFSSAMAAPQRPRREEGSTDVGFVTAFAALVQPTSSSIQFKSSAAKEYSSSPSHARPDFLAIDFGQIVDQGLASQTSSSGTVFDLTDTVSDSSDPSSDSKVPRAVGATPAVNNLSAATTAAQASTSTAIASDSSLSTKSAPATGPLAGKKTVCSPGSTRKCCQESARTTTTHSLLGIVKRLVTDWDLEFSCMEMANDALDSTCTGETSDADD
ncbi:hypothetical protein VTN49DRAFT_5182 [Thermomyces lanuginosus]|uniref:uncharacterized protein n=1 Tax=Thermomyces lanuginosus TaxID=5541 RepID=UPI003742CE53